MPSLLPTRRAATDLKLSVAAARDTAPPALSEPAQQGPTLNWAIAACSGSLLAAVFGWISCAGLVVLGWLTSDSATLGDAIGVGTQIWLLSNGAGAQIGGYHWTLIPLGLTAVLAAMLSGIASFAARQAIAARGADSDSDSVASGLDRAPAVVGRVSGVMTGSYVAAITVVAVLTGHPGQALRAFGGGLLIAAVATLWGGCRATGYRPDRHWASWARALPRAVAAAQLVMVAAGCIVLTVALATNIDRVTALADSLQVGTVSGIVLLIAQLAFLPNLIIWSASWALGSGFTLGLGSIVSPSSTDLGLLPGLPILGALPPEGPGSTIDVVWLLSGVLAGSVAAVLVMRAHPWARCDETCLVGGLAGTMSGLLFVPLAALTRGDLGTGRLVDLGPRLLEVAVMSVTIMGLAGMVVGLVWGLARPRPE